MEQSGRVAELLGSMLHSTSSVGEPPQHIQTLPAFMTIQRESIL